MGTGSSSFFGGLAQGVGGGMPDLAQIFLQKQQMAQRKDTEDKRTKEMERRTGIDQLSMLLKVGDMKLDTIYRDMEVYQKQLADEEFKGEQADKTVIAALRAKINQLSASAKDTTSELEAAVKQAGGISPSVAALLERSGVGADPSQAIGADGGAKPPGQENKSKVVGQQPVREPDPKGYRVGQAIWDKGGQVGNVAANPIDFIKSLMTIPGSLPQQPPPVNGGKIVGDGVVMDSDFDTLELIDNKVYNKTGMSPKEIEARKKALGEIVGLLRGGR